MNQPFAARGSQVAGFTQPRNHFFVHPCTLLGSWACNVYRCNINFLQWSPYLRRSYDSRKARLNKNVLLNAIHRFWDVRRRKISKLEAEKQRKWKPSLILKFFSLIDSLVSCRHQKLLEFNSNFWRRKFFFSDSFI